MGKAEGFGRRTRSTRAKATVFGRFNGIRTGGISVAVKLYCRREGNPPTCIKAAFPAELLGVAKPSLAKVD